ncbi:MAG: CinA family nicotinamide mononucleotide deamidase-related protein [Clostridiales bacterium]|nr:CinA family nicotinamide mononucleotide deamidase-related protein [Clostridiales bacterium]
MKQKRCEIISVGTELLLGDTLNTNAHFLAQGLSRLGLDLYVQTVVGDNPGRMEQAVRGAMARAEILLFTGGLGPTSDDLTKEIVAACFGRQLVMDEAALAGIRDFYALTGRVMPKSNEKQALMPEGGILLANAQGTAPGCILFSDEGHIAILMPGPPREMQPMFDSQVAPFLAQFATGRLYSRVVRVVSLGESQMAEMLHDLIDRGTNPTLAPYASNGEAYVRITCRAASQAEANLVLAPVVEEVVRRLGRHAYGVDIQNLETLVTALLRERHLRIAVAEAGTAGLMAQRLQSTPMAPNVCGPCLSAPNLPVLKQAMDIAIEPDVDTERTCALLSQQLRSRCHTQAAMVIALAEKGYTCAVSLDRETTTFTRPLPPRGLDYHRTQATQAALDALRLMLLSWNR